VTYLSFDLLLIDTVMQELVLARNSVFPLSLLLPLSTCCTLELTAFQFGLTNYEDFFVLDVKIYFA